MSWLTPRSSRIWSAPRDFEHDWLWKMVMSLMRGNLPRRRGHQPAQVFGARDVDGAQRAQVRRRPLHVEEPCAVDPQELDSCPAGHLRRVARAMEHRLPGEQAPVPQPVETADQL